MEEEKLYGCSIAQSIINKNQNRGNLGTSFSGCLVSIDDLKECIKRGCAFSYVFKNNHRLASNFDGTQILAADIDGGITIEDALNHPLVSQSASFIYTTVNHQPDDPHFRVVFALDKGIFDKDELRQVAKALAIRLSGDRRVIDPGRVFYGSTDCEIFHVGKELSEETVRELSAQGKELLESAKHSTNGDHGTFRSSIPLENDLIVVLPSRQSVPLYSIQRNTSIFCPDHNDVHPSAFVGFSDKGGCFIHCRKCQTTRWLKGSDTPYDFNDFDKSVKKIASEDDYETTRVRGFAFYYQEKRKVGGRIHLSHEEKFKIKELQEGITFVKSPKGSGKTTMLPEIFRDKAFNIKGGTLSFEELEENEDPEGEPLYQSEATNFSILLIGHRQSLIRELCKRIGLNCYLDDYEGKAGTSFHEQRRFSEPFRIDQRQKRYGVCLDSLPILRRDQYDLIIIDESEQVLSHFLSDTMKNKRYHVFDLFRKHLQRAKYVVCLDADLGWVTFNTVCELADAESFDECVRKEGIKDKKSKKSIASRPVNIYLNEFKKQGDEIKLYANKNQLDAEIEDDVKNGKKIFVASNSKDRVILLHKHLKKEFPDKKFLCVTSDNSKSPDVQSVIVDLKKKIPTYDAVLASPSLSTGVDITFANEEKLIDVVYGLFEQRITDHFEMDQQIHRVRHPKEVKVWISPQKFYFETDVAVLSVADQSNILSANTYADFDAVEFDNRWGNSSSFFRMSTLIESRKRASFNSLKENFRRHKEDNGYHVVDVEKNDDLSKAGAVIKKKSTENERKEKILAILQSEPIDQRKFLKIKKAKKNLKQISPTDQLSYQKASIEFHYRCDASNEIIDDYLDHGLDSVFLLEVMLHFSQPTDDNLSSSKVIFKDLKLNDLRKKIEDQHPEVISIKSPDVLAVLLLDIFSTTPIFDNGKFDPEKIITKKDLDQFVAIVKKHKNLFATYMISIRADLADNPVRFLGELLKLVGLKFGKYSRDQSGGKTDYLYHLDKDSFEFMMGIIERRQNLPADDYTLTYWKAVHQRHGFKSSFYVRSRNDRGGDDWDLLFDDDLEETFRLRREDGDKESLLEILANA